MKFNPELKEFKTMWGLWWGMLWRTYAVIFALYIFFAIIGFLSIGYNAL